MDDKRPNHRACASGMESPVRMLRHDLAGLHRRGSNDHDSPDGPRCHGPATIRSLSAEALHPDKDGGPSATCMPFDWDTPTTNVLQACGVKCPPTPCRTGDPAPETGWQRNRA